MTVDRLPEQGGIRVDRRGLAKGVLLGTLAALRGPATSVANTSNTWAAGFSAGMAGFGVIGMGENGLQLMKPIEGTVNPKPVASSETAGPGLKDLSRDLTRVVLGIGTRGLELQQVKDGSGGPEQGLPWINGKYQLYSRDFLREADGRYRSIFHQFDVGTLGPDVDTIVGVDFLGDLPTGFKVISSPPVGEPVIETRVIFVKRTDLSYVQLNDSLSADVWDLWRVSEHGGDAMLGNMLEEHAKRSAHTHQKVVLIGDLGLAQTQWPNEASFFRTIIRAQVPPRLGIPESNFVAPRAF